MDHRTEANPASLISMINWKGKENAQSSVTSQSFIDQLGLLNNSRASQIEIIGWKRDKRDSTLRDREHLLRNIPPAGWDRCRVRTGSSDNGQRYYRV